MTDSPAGVALAASTARPPSSRSTAGAGVGGWAATPNPTHEGTSFRIGLPERALIDFAIYDLRGREVRRVARGEMPAGENLVHWDGRDRSGGLAPSGLYFYRLRIKNRVWSGRIVMAR